MEFSTLFIGLFLGIGLAAASGFRVFLPLFVLSMAIYFNWGDFLGMGTLTPSFLWIGSIEAMIILGFATLIEVFSYYVPFIDNLLDTMAVPLAAIAGTLLVASQLVELPDVISWSLAIIAGGGTAATISGSLATTRVVSSGATAGMGNFIVATFEVIASVGLSLLSFIIPILAFLVALTVLVCCLFVVFRFRKKRQANSKN